jgi:hypothetical protein
LVRRAAALGFGCVRGGESGVSMLYAVYFD